MRNNGMKKTAGFTLMELMIVVAIMGILAAVAYPSYRDYIVRSRRSEARAALNEVAAKMQQYYLDNKRYTKSDGTSPSIGDVGFANSQLEGYYAVTITAADGPPPTFTLKATPTSKGRQDADTTCAIFTLNQFGTRNNETSGGADLDETKCW